MAGLRRKKPMARGGRINPVSARRRARDADYENQRIRVFQRARGRCQMPACVAQMTDVHHLAGRDGPDPHRLGNLVGLCRFHHNYVHANPAWAYANGWLIRRNGKGDDVH